MNNQALHYFISCYKGWYRSLITSFIFSVAQSLKVLPIALLVKYATDTLIAQKRLADLIEIGGVILGLYVFNALVTYWSRYNFSKAIHAAVETIQEDILKKFYLFSREKFLEMDRGVLHSIVIEDTARVWRMSNQLLAFFLPSVIICIGLTAILIFLNWKIFLSLVITIPVMVYFTRKMGYGVKRLTKVHHSMFQKVSKGMMFVLNAMELTKLQAADTEEIKRQTKGIKEYRDNSLALERLKIQYRQTQELVLASASVIVLVMGGIEVSGGLLTIGELLSFFVALSMLQRFAEQIMSSITIIIDGQEALTRIFDLITTEEYLPYRGKKAIVFNGGIQLKSVSFGYSKDIEDQLFREANFELYPGKIAALIGPNGSGKTTIVNLILGYYRPNSGVILADGQDFVKLNIPSLRRQIGIVPQNPLIFNGTILENITYGNPISSMEDIYIACEFAAADDFIRLLKHGIDTQVGEFALFLSGGQRQKLALARALLKKPRLLILDEPTNHLDTEAVTMVVERLGALPFKPAILIISHEWEVVDLADFVYEIQKDRISMFKKPDKFLLAEDTV